jgi:predicted RNase H-like HicB family nuclease
MRLTIEIEREDDGRFIAEVPELPGTMVYGQTREEATARVQALALRVLADRLQHGEEVPAVVDAFLVAP